MTFGSVAWLERGLDFKYKEYEFDQDFFLYLIENVSKFWNDNVIKNVAPNPVSSSDIELMFSRHREGAVMEATPEILSAYTELISVREAIKELERSETELTEMIKTVMRDNEIIQSSGKQLFTWRSPKPSQLFDLDRFQTEHPELYLQYMTEKSGSRRFLIKN
jgi:predicted phage-related endonuclease